MCAAVCCGRNKAQIYAPPWPPTTRNKISPAGSKGHKSAKGVAPQGRIIITFMISYSWTEHSWTGVGGESGAADDDDDASSPPKSPHGIN